MEATLVYVKIVHEIVKLICVKCRALSLHTELVLYYAGQKADRVYKGQQQDRNNDNIQRWS